MEDHVGWILIATAALLLGVASLLAWLEAVVASTRSVEMAGVAMLAALGGLVLGVAGARGPGPARAVSIGSAISCLLLLSSLAVPQLLLVAGAFHSGAPSVEIGGGER